MKGRQLPSDHGEARSSMRTGIPASCEDRMCGRRRTACADVRYESIAVEQHRRQHGEPLGAADLGRHLVYESDYPKRAGRTGRPRRSPLVRDAQSLQDHASVPTYLPIASERNHHGKTSSFSAITRSARHGRRLSPCRRRGSVANSTSFFDGDTGAPPSHKPCSNRLRNRRSASRLTTRTLPCSPRGCRFSTSWASRQRCLLRAST